MSAASRKSPLTSTIGQKFIVAITGLFLISFLVVHLSGNLLLLKNDGGESFNAYAEFMGSNPLILVMEVVLFAGFLAHIVLAVAFSARNRAARPVPYKLYKGGETATFASRFMLVSGLVMLLFLVLHLFDFFFPYKAFGHPGEGGLYAIAQAKFQIPWVVAFYVVSMGLLFLHLSHGFRSAFQSFGIQLNSRLGNRLGAAGYFIAAILSLGLAIIPIVILVK